MTAQTAAAPSLLLLVAVNAVDVVGVVVVAGRLCKKRGAMYAEVVAYGTKELHLRVRTGVTLRDARLNALVFSSSGGVRQAHV